MHLGARSACTTTVQPERVVQELGWFLQARDTGWGRWRASRSEVDEIF
jgi:hypothetical protein